MIDKIVYYLLWGVKTILLKEKIPLNCSIILTDECNLHCKHCTVAHLGYQPRTLVDVQKDLETLYATGARVLVITGGEPFIWKDVHENTVENVVTIARRMGFFRIVICTNGTYSLQSSADYLWVSLDGFETAHNTIRGSIYNWVIDNIQSSNHKGIYVNFTISSNNVDSFQDAAEFILKIKNIKGILFHLYTKYIGGDESLVLTPHKRLKVLEKLSRFKKKHPIKVFNTFAGIQVVSQSSLTLKVVVQSLFVRY